MPLLSHKPSKNKLRKSSVPAPLDFSNSSSSPVPGALPTPPLSASMSSASASPIPTDPSSSSSSFKFWKKTSPSGTTATTVQSSPTVNAQMPKPILRRPSEGIPSLSIRFASKPTGQVLQGPMATAVQSHSQPQLPSQSQAQSQQAYGRPRSSSQSNVQPIAVANIQSYAVAQQPLPQQRASSYYEVQLPPSGPASNTTFGAHIVPPSARPVSSYIPPAAILQTSATGPIRAPSARRSSRPSAPSSNSFGTRVLPPTPIAQAHPPATQNPLTTPPISTPSHVTTPPAAYVSTMQSRASPPPSPYRPTSTREQQPLWEKMYSSSTGSAQQPTAPRPLCHPSLAQTADISSLSTHQPPTPLTPGTTVVPMFGSIIDNSSVPMLNIIPATPQEASEEFASRACSARRSSGTWSGLDDAAMIDEKEMVEIALDANTSTPTATPSTIVVGLPSIYQTEIEDKSSIADLISHPSMPVLELNLDFSPFEPLVSLPSSSTISEAEDLPLAVTAPVSTPASTFSEKEREITCSFSQLQFSNPVTNKEFEEHARRASTPPTDPLPPSPPFESYPSLPSLASMQSSSSADSIRSSSSDMSLSAFPDVEEALGSMLRSLSNNSVADPSAPRPISVPVSSNSYTSKDTMSQGNPGLGLGLELPDQISSVSVTAPLSLSPRRRSPGPAPLDLGLAKRANVEPAFRSAPPVINHRVAFYNTAKAYPGSSSSSLANAESMSEDGKVEQNEVEFDDFDEDEDDDLHTASIISLTPVLSERPIMVETDLVGLAL